MLHSSPSTISVPRIDLKKMLKLQIILQHFLQEFVKIL